MDRVLSRFTPASGITPHFGSIRRPSSGIVFAQSSRTWQVRRPRTATTALDLESAEVLQTIRGLL